ncbi:MAG: nucleotidyltransferase domain-containing protein [Nanoarchaeota archaeon]
MVKIMTERENEIIAKKLSGVSLTQNEANILSKSIRPKLLEIGKINTGEILNRIEYNQKARAIENKIKKIVLDNVPNLDSIIICGSAVQSNYKEYNDIDVIVVTKKELPKSKKRELIETIEKKGKKAALNLDMQLYSKDSILSQYSHSPSLIYQLKDFKAIHGTFNLLPKADLSKLDLRMKLDWSDIDDEDSAGREIYQSLRNVMLVRLLLRKIVDNKMLNESVRNELGERLMKQLKSNSASKLEKKRALMYIRNLSEKTDKEILESKWEKIVL